jgi:hypothetical protein
MSFWTGLEALSGHRPGAFTGMTMRDLFDKDMWDRLPRTWSGQRTPTGPLDIRTGRAGEPMMTAWRRGGNQAGNEAAHTQHAMANRPASYPDMRATYPAMPAQVQTRPLAPKPNLNPQPVPGFYPYSGRTHGGGMVDPNWSSATAVNRPPTMVPQFDSTMADMTTVKKVTDDSSPNTITQTIKQKVPANPTNTLMNMGQKFISGWQDLARKRYEEEMRERQDRMRFRQNPIHLLQRR